MNSDFMYNGIYTPIPEFKIVFGKVFYFKSRCRFYKFNRVKAMTRGETDKMYLGNTLIYLIKNRSVTI
jgi:hypothetical protein